MNLAASGFSFVALLARGPKEQQRANLILWNTCIRSNQYYAMHPRLTRNSTTNIVRTVLKTKHLFLQTAASDNS